MTQKIISDLYDEDTGEDPIQDLLNSVGLKASKPRLRVMAEMYEAGKPLSIRELQKNVPEIDSSSIYRTLNSLVENNIIKTVYAGGTDIYYELILGKKDRHHIICIHCRDIEAIDACIEGRMEHDVLSHSKNFSRLSHHSLEFFGLCKTCVRKTV
jgi:Fe2+ or Zn2+ uptake regulation protein